MESPLIPAPIMTVVLGLAAGAWFGDISGMLVIRSDAILDVGFEAFYQAHCR